MISMVKEDVVRVALQSHDIRVTGDGPNIQAIAATAVKEEKLVALVVKFVACEVK